jgi:hypothetical protein
MFVPVSLLLSRVWMMVSILSSVLLSVLMTVLVYLVRAVFLPQSHVEGDVDRLFLTLAYAYILPFLFAGCRRVSIALDRFRSSYNCTEG